MKLKSVEAIHLRWISDGKTIADIARIEQQTVEEVQQKLAVICRRLGAGSIVEAVEKAKSSNMI